METTNPITYELRPVDGEPEVRGRIIGKINARQPWVRDYYKDEEETLDSIIDYLREHEPELWHNFVAVANALKNRYQVEKVELIDRAIEKTEIIEGKIEGICRRLKRIEAKQACADEAKD